MPIRFHIDVSRGRVVTEISGHVVDEDVAAYQRALRAHPSFDHRLDQLVDVDPATEIAVGGEQIRRAALDNPFRTGSRRAVVAPSDAAFGLARMYESLTDGHSHELRVFREHGEALAWLGSGAAHNESERTPPSAGV